MKMQSMTNEVFLPQKMNLRKMELLKVTASLQEKDVLDDTTEMPWANPEREKGQEKQPVSSTNKAEGKTKGRKW